MLTDDMVDGHGRAREVYSFFHRRIEKMQGLTSNWWSLQHTAQCIEKGDTVDQILAAWEGFESVWIPVAPGVQLHAFIGFAVDGNGRIADADCIVLLPGLWGDNGARRNKDLSLALQSSGFHVLSLEPRGHGQTEAEYPDVYYNFAVLETQDLMKVSEWLQDTYPHIRRTGLIGFCWGANAALVAAWFDGRSSDDPSITKNLARHLDPPSSREHFAAGVMAFSPLLRWEHFLDRMDKPRSVWIDPSPAMFQEATRAHMWRKAFPEETGSLRRCIAYDFAQSVLGQSFPVLDGNRFLRLLPYRGQPDGDKLESARMPVLIVHSINDPLQTAQEVADLVAQTANPKVAAVLLPGGGHIGFQAYCRAYYYSMIMNFFDPVCGPASNHQPTLTEGPAVVKTSK
jgi:predicted alpha/beta-fold hydrolase